MNSVGDQVEDRIAQAGADVLAIAETTVLIVLDDPLQGQPWEHPAWALCRGLGALGFGTIHLSGAGEHAGDFSTLMEGRALDAGTATRPVRLLADRLSVPGVVSAFRPWVFMKVKIFSETCSSANSEGVRTPL